MSSSTKSEEEYGFLDLLDAFEKNNDQLVSTLANMSDATERIGSDITNGTAALNELGQIQSKSQRVQAKRILAEMSKDMDRFSSVLESELPAFSRSGRAALDSLSHALVVYEDFDSTDADTLGELVESVMGMQDAAQGCLNGLQGWKDTLAKTPRVTTQFNKSKRKVIDLLDRVTTELRSTVETTGNIQEAIHKLLGV